MSAQLQVTGEAKIRDIQGPVVANDGVITALDGAASQYVRGDGTLADFPTSGGGGSSVSYYLNSSVSQGTIGGVAYRELSKEPIIGAGTDIPISANGYVANYITDVNDPDVILVPGGNFNCEFYFSVNNNTGNPSVYAELYKYNGTTFTLLGSSVAVPESINQGTTIAPYYFAIPVATATLALTDRLAIRIYVNVDGRTVTLHTENGHLCQVVTTLSKGMLSLNNLTDQSQYLAVGTSGTNFNIVSSGDTHTFNLPIASATNTGKLSSSDWSIFNNKVPYTGANADVDLGTFNLSTLGTLLSKYVYVGGNGTNSGFLSFNQYATPDLSGTNATSIYTTSNNKVNFRFWQSGLSYKTFNFDVASLTAGSERTFTLPDASGTLALTSNLSSYVPYTGATTSVNLGIYNLTSSGLIVSVPTGTAASNLFYINNVLTGGIVSGSTYFQFDSKVSGGFLFNNSAGEIILILQDNKVALFYGGIINNGFTNTTALGLTGTGGVTQLTSNATSNKSIIVPNVDGTMALTSDLGDFVTLSTYQTITANKTFSGWIQANTLFLNNASSISSATGFGTLTYNKSGSLSTFRITNDNNATASLIFDNTTNYNYTYPATSGTLALISDLSGYVTLSTTQTISGAKTFSAATVFSSTTTHSGVASFGTGSPTAFATDGTLIIPKIRLYNTTPATIYSDFVSAATTNRSITVPDASGTLALTSNLSAYLPLTGGTLSGALTMGAYSFASSAIQFTRAATNTISPGSGNGILVFGGGNAQMRINTNNAICFDMNNGGTPYTSLLLQQNGNTVLIDSPNNYLSLGLGYQGTYHGFLGGFSSALYAYSNNGGQVYLTNGSAWVPTSDIKRKKNFETYNLGLNAILGLEAKLYHMDFQKDSEEKQVGLIAQQVREHIPQAFEQNEDFIGLNYNVIIVTLVNAIQEQQAQIDELKAKIK